MVKVSDVDVHDGRGIGELLVIKTDGRNTFVCVFRGSVRFFRLRSPHGESFSLKTCSTVGYGLKKNLSGKSRINLKVFVASYCASFSEVCR